MIDLEIETEVFRAWIRCGEQRSMHVDRRAVSVAGGAAEHLIRAGWKKVGEPRRQVGHLARSVYVLPPPDTSFVRQDGRRGVWLDILVPSDMAATRIAHRLHANATACTEVDAQRLWWWQYHPAGSLRYTTHPMQVFPSDNERSEDDAADPTYHYRDHSEAVVAVVGLSS